MAGELGRASYALDADLEPLRRNIKQSRAEVSDFERVLDSLTAVADIAADQLKHVKIERGQSSESKASAEGISSGVRGIKEDARGAARELKDVKLDQAQAVESRVAADEISGGLDKISRNARQAKRNLEEVALVGTFDPSTGRFRGNGGRFVAGGAGGAAGGAAGGIGGIGGAGGGFGGGGIGLLGAAIAGGTLLAPAAGPAMLGLLGALPVLASTGAGALGTLALAFDGVGKAIGGDKRAFDELGPSAQAFVQTVRSLDEWFDKLKETAAGSLFPGLTAGLKSALSSGTLSALTNAVAEFGHAIGDAGAAWGKYFGSAQFQNIFGPLMASGARNFSSMSDAALHLFDAIGVLGRAAIPFTEWMVKGIDAGSRWADAFMRAKDASGGLGGALNEAQTSLRLVGNLFVSIGRAVYELGAALYPVSKIAVKDLTDGFNALSEIIDRNKQTIRDIVSGALSALVSMIKALVPVVTALVHGIEDVVQSIGGWKVAFEIILGGMLAAKVAKLASSFGDVALAVGGTAAKLGKLGLAADAVVGEVGGLRGALIALGDGVVLGALGAVAAGIAGLMFAWSKGFTTPNPTVVGPSPVSSQTIGGANVVMVGGKYYIQAAGRLTPYNGPIPSTPTRDAMRGASAPHGGTTGYYQQEAAQFATQYGVPAGLFTAQINQESGFNPNAVSSAGAKGIAQFMPGTAKGLGVNPDDPTSSLSGAAKLMASYYKKYGRWDFALAAYNGGPGAVDYFVKHGYYPAAETTNYVNSILGASGIPGGAEPGAASPFAAAGAFTKNLGPKATMPTGANLLPEALRNALQAAKDKATTTQGATAAVWLHTELADLEKARKDLDGQLAGSSGKKRAAIQAELRSIDGQIATVNKSITTNLHQQAQAVKTAFSSKISAAKSTITSAIETLKGTLDAQLQEHLQTQIDTVLAPKFFQGTDEHGMPLQTPAEAKLAGEQAADTLKSLQDAITQATDPASRAAAQRQLDEYNDSIAATKERAQADRDFADAVKKAQADEAESQRQLNLQLDVFGKGLANGTTKLGDLGSLVEAFGLSLTAPGGITEDFAYLQGAVSGLADVLIAKAQALGAVGDAKDAHAAALAAAGLVIPAGAPAVIPGTRIDFAGLVAAAMARNTIGMAAGGIGRATMPTLFYSGGDEDFAFSGEGSSFADASRSGETHVHIHGGTFIGGNKQQVARDLKPYLERITTLTK